ncbi:efflux RND transporter periplasmic adaptor subunit [Streptomyces coryli]|nr:peptidoglycan-binding protein [Streptomyces coryli]
MQTSQEQEKEKAQTSPPESAEPGPKTRRSRRGLKASVAVALMAVTGGAIVATDPFEARTPAASTEDSIPTGTATVTKGTLSARTQENGTLGYMGSYDVVNKANGTVTGLPAQGEVIRHGKPLYRVDGKPVYLLKGSAPAYRELSREMEGPDVRQLNAALVGLGYATKSQIDPDSDYFGWQTYYALKELQEKLGLKETGKLPLGQAVFLPVTELRVTKTEAVNGTPAAPGRTIVQGTSTKREVSIELSASQQAKLAVGDKVTITLPDGKTTDGKVSKIGKVATQGKDKTTIDVKIQPTDPKATGSLDKAPVQVSIVSDTAKNVLMVPVDSLLALSGGGYAVEAVRPGGTRKLIPVETGLFDDDTGKVQVTGDGLAVGQKIVVPG